MSLLMFAAVGAGGAIGAMARYGVAQMVGAGLFGTWPGRWQRWSSMSPAAR